MDSKKLELIILSVFFVGLSILTFFVFQPFLNIIVLAIVLSIFFHPLYKKLIAFFHGGKSVIAVALVIVALVFLIIPILFLGLQVLAQAQSFFSLTQADQGHYIQTLDQSVNSLVQHIIPNFSFNILDSMNKILAFVSNNLGQLLSQTTYIFFQIFFLLFTFFFLLRDGEKILNSFISFSPFEKERNKELVNLVYQTTTSVIQETLVVGLIRFVLIGAAFYFLGIPNFLLWGSIGGIIGVLPGLGTPFVIIPAFLYLLFYGNLFSAIGMLLFGILLFFFIDNLLSAYFFKKGSEVPPLFILFSILGGIMLFGPLGFVFGPIILSLFISILGMYKILVLKKF